jgi:hypothetical protein
MQIFSDNPQLVKDDKALNCYSSSVDSTNGKLSDEQSDCRLGSLNCEQGFDETISISRKTNIRIPSVKKPNACILLVNG